MAPTTAPLAWGTNEASHERYIYIAALEAVELRQAFPVLQDKSGELPEVAPHSFFEE